MRAAGRDPTDDRSLAHELGRTRDWVVIYFHDDDHREGRRAVVTESQAGLEGLRVVRGRAEECRRFCQEPGNTGSKE